MLCRIKLSIYYIILKFLISSRLQQRVNIWLFSSIIHECLDITILIQFLSQLQLKAVPNIFTFTSMLSSKIVCVPTYYIFKNRFKVYQRGIQGEIITKSRLEGTYFIKLGSFICFHVSGQ